MDIIRDITTSRIFENTAVTVGTFDGVHSGHLEIIKHLKEEAKLINGKSVVVTFDPHPKEVVGNNDKPPMMLLTTFEEKLELLAELGIDIVVAIPFTEKFAQTPPQTFVREVLSAKLGARTLVVGFDHSFGKERSGNIEMLKNIGETEGFIVRIVPPSEIDGAIISSTLIRRFLIEGDITRASKFLGRDYTIKGEVVKGDGIGSEIGFPTANLEISNKLKLIPRNGVYCVGVEYGGQVIRGMMNIGLRPTFNGSSRTVETNLFTETIESLYHEELKVEFLKRIRDEVKFDSTEHLIAQLKKDKEACRQN